ncbi:DUF6266 family protein [Mangrovimonas sp. YM274]|uniref:DUF6266 family protein n=1 Tax=Mangrovimonas sp. YM274 TaxID=3070660 RepID=UPI0027DB775D|nr:DUF6266 family protein [Mangrovimonas sp. YM274]WMI69040.1 DUF6266 family protein [Mangrovimonas sp. YM274]
MAQLPNGIMGGISGKLGPLAGTSWKGINVFRSIPANTNHQPTPAQQQQHDKFKTVSAFLNPLKQLINHTFNASGLSKTGYNLAMSYHLREALLPQGDSFKIQYAKALVAMGPLRGLEVTHMQQPTSGQLQLQWLDNSTKAMAHPTDKLVIVLYSPQTHNYFWQLTDTPRNSQQFSMALPDVSEGMQWHVWAAFMDTYTQTASLSDYFGVVEV